MNIYISTLAFLGKNVEDIITIAQDEQLSIEFSSGLPYRKDMENIFLNAPVNKIIHNYFPAPKDPFVINLSSINNEIRDKSIRHCLNGLSLTKKCNGKFYAAHAGFCIDPMPNQLGKKIESETSNIDIHRELFISSLSEIISYAKSLDLVFLIENNVISSQNYKSNLNPFLCTESTDIKWIFEKMSTHNNFGLLLDTGHLKVSCQTLGIDLNSELLNIMPFIKALHHSDNNGFEDSNEILKNDYWFFNHLNKFNSLPHVLEIKDLSVSEIHNQIKLFEKYGN